MAVNSLFKLQTFSLVLLMSDSQAEIPSLSVVSWCCNTVRTEIWQRFSRTKWCLLLVFSRHFFHLYVNKNITKLAFKCGNLLYNVFFYSIYQMWLTFLNFKLQMLCVMNCEKINKCIGNQQCNRHLHFPGEHYSFKGFFQIFPYLWSFSRPWKSLH